MMFCIFLRGSMIKNISFKRLSYSSLALLGICTSLFIWIFISLFSYSPYDPSIYTYQNAPYSSANYLGIFGAYTASTLFYFFGSAAFGILLLLAFAIWNIIFQINMNKEFDRYIAYGILICIGASLCTVHTFGHTIYGCAGGKVGFSVVHFFAQSLDKTTVTFILWSLFIGMITIIMHYQLYLMSRIIMHASHYMYAHRSWAITIGKYTGKIIIVCAQPFIAAGKYFYTLCSGKRIKKWTNDVLLDEYNPESEHDSAFLEELLSQIPEANDENRHEHELSTGAWHEAETESDENKPSTINDSMHYATKESSPQYYQLPPLESFAHKKKKTIDPRTAQEHEQKAKLLEEKLAHFGISGKVVAIKHGPVVTLYEYQPEIDARISKITALDDDLALALQALSIRIIAPIPGTAYIGFEVANTIRDTVFWSDIMQSESAQSFTGSLPLAIGCDTSGSYVISDLAKMPHLLVAGSTGSGKSVALQTMIVSLLCSCTPDELRLILIDPKRLEFAAYTDIAHLLFPIITHAKHAIGALKWAVKEMEERYEEMKRVGARNIIDYHAYAAKHADTRSMPYLVIIVDEFADLMMMGGREIEELITRITQMARAAGIHMIIATQRPSVDVITGVIKVNFPSRIACRVASKVDSRTILDCNGAEKLLGRGDMLMIDATDPGIKRVHGAYASDDEIMKIIQHIREQRAPQYIEIDTILANTNVDIHGTDDALYDDIIAFVTDLDEVSISLLQRKFRIGYNRSARIIEALEAQGVIAASDGSKMRKVIHQ